MLMFCPTAQLNIDTATYANTTLPETVISEDISSSLRFQMDCFKVPEGMTLPI